MSGRLWCCGGGESNDRSNGDSDGDSKRSRDSDRQIQWATAMSEGSGEGGS